MKKWRVQLLATSTVLLLSAASAAENPCYKAYWNGKDAENFTKCEAMATKGEANDEFDYGLILWSGHDREPNRGKAFEWFKKSACQGYLMAQIALGSFMSHEESDPAFQNLPEAYAWFRTAEALEAANRVLSRLNGDEIQKAKKLAGEYEAKYKK